MPLPIGAHEAGWLKQPISAMRPLYQLLLALLLANGCAGPSQAAGPTPRNPRRDSVEAALRLRPRPDSARLFTLNEVIWENRDSNPARALALAAEALALGQRLHSLRGMAKTYVLRGIIYDMSGRLAESIADFEACRRLRTQLRDWEGVAGAINNIGEVQAQQGRYTAAVRTYVAALRLEEKYGNPDRIAADLANLGLVYFQMGRYREALNYQLRFLHLPGRHFYANNDAIACNAAGQAYARLGQPDSARRYFGRALALSRSNDDRRDEAQALVNLGRLDAQAGRPGPATTALRQGLQIQQQLDDQLEQAQTLLALADLEAARQQPGRAVGYYQQALALARRTHSPESQRAARAGLAAAYARLGNFAQAYNEGRQAAALRDSLLDETSIRQIVEMQTRYETERKETQNRLLRKQQQLQAARLAGQQQIIRRRSVQMWAGLVIAGLLAGVGYLAYHRRRLRREIEFAQERQLLTQQRAAAVLAAEEAERRRIGADLHDGVGQLLSVVKLHLSGLSEELESRLDPGEQQRFATAIEVVDESVREVRGISHDLLPNALLKRGLALAVREFLDRLRRPGQLNIQLETFGLAAAHLPTEVEYALYRVVQEAVQNIVKHAHATAITLQLICHPGELTLVVEDNGVGFGPAAPGAEAGIGLHNMAGRIAYLGGELLVDSSPGRGTTLTAVVPLPAGAAQ